MRLIEILLLIPLLLAVPDLTGSQQFLFSLSGIHSEMLLLLSVAAFLLLRIFTGFAFTDSLRRLFFVVFIATIAISISATIVEFVTFPNFIYSHFRLHYDVLFFMSLVVGIFSIGSLETKVLRKYKTLFLFLLPFIIVGINAVVWMWPYEKMFALTREDSLVEYLQFLTLVIGSLYALKVAMKLLTKQKGIGIMYLLVSLVLFFVAGDEISWGQRIFGIATPEALNAINSQHETTIHNIMSFDGLVPIVYLCIGIYGSLLSFVVRTVSKNKYLMFFFPQSLFFFYFFIPALINFHPLTQNLDLRTTAEIAELMLYLGTSIFITNLFYTMQPNILGKKHSIF